MTYEEFIHSAVKRYHPRHMNELYPFLAPPYSRYSQLDLTYEEWLQKIQFSSSLLPDTAACRAIKENKDIIMISENPSTFIVRPPFNFGG